jgi:U1 small nuclear ribonucleoprotein C
MPRFFCDYCDAYLTHDSAPGRQQHIRGWKHRENFKAYYQQFLPQWEAEQMARQGHNFSHPGQYPHAYLPMGMGMGMGMPPVNVNPGVPMGIGAVPVTLPGGVGTVMQMPPPMFRPPPAFQPPPAFPQGLAPTQPIAGQNIGTEVSADSSTVLAANPDGVNNSIETTSSSNDSGVPEIVNSVDS